ncbi:MAG: Ig-like domain-containing protein [Myxococcota bacterium]
MRRAATLVTMLAVLGAFYVDPREARACSCDARPWFFAPPADGEIPTNSVFHVGITFDEAWDVDRPNNPDGLFLLGDANPGVNPLPSVTVRRASSQLQDVLTIVPDEPLLPNATYRLQVAYFAQEYRTGMGPSPDETSTVTPLALHPVHLGDGENSECMDAFRFPVAELSVDGVAPGTLAHIWVWPQAEAQPSTPSFFVPGAWLEGGCLWMRGGACVRGGVYSQPGVPQCFRLALEDRSGQLGAPSGVVCTDEHEITVATENGAWPDAWPACGSTPRPDAGPSDAAIPDAALPDAAAPSDAAPAPSGDGAAPDAHHADAAGDAVRVAGGCGCHAGGNASPGAILASLLALRLRRARR